MLTTPTRLRDKLVTLDRDLSGLGGHRVALLGFRDPDAERVDGNIRSARESPGWTLVDARGGPCGRLRPAPKGRDWCALSVDRSDRLFMTRCRPPNG